VSKDGLFWKLKNPMALVAIMPLIVLELVLLSFGRGPAWNLTSLLQGVVVVMFGASLLLALSARKVNNENADRDPMKYIKRSYSIRKLRYLQFFLIALLIPIATLAHFGTNIYSIGGPIGAVLTALAVIYAVSLEVAVTPFAVLRVKSLLMSRINLIAGLQSRSQLRPRLVDSVCHFSDEYAVHAGWKIRPECCREVRDLPPSDQRTLALNLLPRVKAASETDNFIGFLLDISRSLNRADYHEILERADYRYRVVKLLKDFGPVFAAISAGGAIIGLAKNLKFPLASRSPYQTS
jgi:hypothetical protein